MSSIMSGRSRTSPVIRSVTLQRSSRYNWLKRELETIQTRKFHVVEALAGAELLGEPLDANRQARIIASRRIDQKYGTSLAHDVWSTIMEGRFTPYP
jgi:hypothetical protein